MPRPYSFAFALDASSSSIDLPGTNLREMLGKSMARTVELSPPQRAVILMENCRELDAKK